MKKNLNLMVSSIGILILVAGCAPKVKTLDLSTAATDSENACTQTYPDFTNSMSFRADNASFDPMNPGTRTLATLIQETAGTLVASGNSLIPNPYVDTDGRYTDVAGTVAKRNYLETVKGRPTKVCGLSGTNAERIEDCATQNTAIGVNKALYEGSKYGQSGESDWKLVTLYKASAVAGDTCAGGFAGGCFEVWRDERTQQVWSDFHNNNGNAWNWFQAAGYSKNGSTQVGTYYEGGTPAATGLTYDVSQCSDPSLYTCQGNTPISVCADAATIAGTNGVATYQNPDGTNGTYDERPAKGNLTGASRQWRLPTIEDWNIANANGIRKVLPNMDNGFWSASSLSNGRSSAWFFGGGSGSLDSDGRNGNDGVRCVGR